VKSVLPNICAAYNALGIQRALNEAGDLATANYIFWTVGPIPGGYAWESYATWVASEDRIIAKP
jgi:hypothetical protein